jgi:hypothetical protein
MKATRLLELQHSEAKRLFRDIDASEDSFDARETFQDLARALVAHDAIERELFYPECEKLLGDTPSLAQSVAEHDLVVFSLRQAMLAMDDAFPEPSEDDMVKAASSASSGPTRASFRIR